MLNVVMIAVVWSITIGSAFMWRGWYLERSQCNDGCKTTPSPFGLIDVVLMFAAVLILPGLVIASLLHLWGADLSALSPLQLNTLSTASSLTQLIACISVVALGCLRYGTPKTILGFDRKLLVQHFKDALGGFIMVAPFLFGVQWILSIFVPYEHNTIDQLKDNFSWSTILVTWLGAVIAAPICEELFFRGILQNWLQRLQSTASQKNPFVEITGGWGDLDDGDFANSVPDRSAKPRQPSWLASELGLDHDGVRTKMDWWLPIGISSFLFALVHIGQGLAPIPLFIFGLALGNLFRRTGSIVPPILLHFLLNGFSMFWVTLESWLLSIEQTV
ncbi:MAG: CPBP family intramembrane glutamic endopeptidase [Planctomycetota bacterium]